LKSAKIPGGGTKNLADIQIIKIYARTKNTVESSWLIFGSSHINCQQE